MSLLYFFVIQKSADTEVTAQKMQTPIVAKLTECEMGRKTLIFIKCFKKVEIFFILR